jgi:hypothetical protein
MKYYQRGFDIAMCQPVIQEQTEKILNIIQKHGTFIYSTLRGIYKLAYLLIRYHKLAVIPKIQSTSDYTYDSLSRVVAVLCAGVEKVDFVYNTDLDLVMFKGVSCAPTDVAGLGRKARKMIARQNNIIRKSTTIPPIRVMRHNVTNQTASDELFTGSFNPVQMAWYEGAIVY